MNSVLRLFYMLYDRVFRFGVFISYRRVTPDQEFVKWLDRRLDQRGFDPFHDEKDLTGGAWHPQLKKQIKSRPGFVVVESPDSFKSDQVADEVTQALLDRRHIVPVLFRVKQARRALKRFQYVDFTRLHNADLLQPSVGHEELDKLARYLKIAPLKNRPFSWNSLQFVLFLFFLGMVSSTFLKAVSTATYARDSEDAVEQIASTIKPINDAMSNAKIIQPTDPRNGRWDYLIPTENEPIASDFRSEGRLVQRAFFQRGRRVAYDEFSYTNDEPTGRNRSILNNAGEVVLIERYSQDGKLASREYRPMGINGPIYTLEADVFRLPLPPAALNVYR